MVQQKVEKMFDWFKTQVSWQAVKFGHCITKMKLISRLARRLVMQGLNSNINATFLKTLTNFLAVVA